MVDVLLDNELGGELKKSNPSKFSYIKDLLKPYRKSIRKLHDQTVDIHEKRKILQKPDLEKAASGASGVWGHFESNIPLFDQRWRKKS